MKPIAGCSPPWPPRPSTRTPGRARRNDRVARPSSIAANQIQRPAAQRMPTAAAQMRQHDRLSAADILQRIGEDGEVLESALGGDGRCQGNDLAGAPLWSE